MLKLTLVTPNKKVLENTEVSKVTIPAYRGELEVHAGHADLITTLETGVLSYTTTDGSNKVAVSWGYCEIFDGCINVLAETAESQTDLDTERAQVAKKTAIEKLSSSSSYEETEKYRLKFQRAEARLKVSE